jgi:uncharacterized protein
MVEIITREMEQLRQMIASTVARRESIKQAMQTWYSEHPLERFDGLNDLILLDNTLSQLDSHYKRLWDFHNAKQA